MAWDGFREWIESGYKLAMATSAGAICYVLLIIGCLTVGKDAHEDTFLLLLALLGVLVGWIAAIGLSPYDHKERSVFGGYAQALGAVVSGFLLARFDRVITQALDPANPGFLFSTLHRTLPVLIFINALLLTLILVFTHRQYRQKDEFERKTAEKAVDLEKREVEIEYREDQVHQRELALETPIPAAVVITPSPGRDVSPPSELPSESPSVDGAVGPPQR